MELHRFRDTMLQPVRRLYAMQGMSIVEFMIAITVGTILEFFALMIVGHSS